MKHIDKGKEPSSLITHRKQQNADYGNLPTKAKKEIREALLQEQGFVCCYCMQRIQEDTMKIEHWKPQRHAHSQLDYHNLLAACDGNEGAERKEQHCDTHKGEFEISINPADNVKNCEHFVEYRKNGTIYSKNHVIDEELNVILNLNVETLKENRATIIDQVKNEITRVKGKNASWPIRYVKKIIRKYENKIDEKYIPYCQVVIYFLKKRFAHEL